MTELVGLPRDTLFTLGQQALIALQTYWPGTPAPPLPDRQFVSNGVVFWDAEQVAISFERMFNIDGDVSGEQWLQWETIAGHRAVIMEVTIIRCVPDVQAQGTRVRAPTTDSIEQSALELYGDAIDVWRVMRAAHKDGALGTCNGIAFQDWNPLGPQGGFGGGISRLRCALL